MVLPLAPGWEEVSDPSTGRTYYWNTRTDATSWERPTAPPPPPEGAAAAGVAASYSADKVFTPDELSGDVAEWMRKHEVIISPGCPPPITTFEAARLPPSIMSEIARAGFTSPTPIQAASWAPALQGRDVIGIAKTGSGKTLGFLAPAFVRILAERRSVSTRPPRLAPWMPHESPPPSLTCGPHPCYDNRCRTARRHSSWRLLASSPHRSTSNATSLDTHLACVPHAYTVVHRRAVSSANCVAACTSSFALPDG